MKSGVLEIARDAADRRALLKSIPAAGELPVLWKEFTPLLERIGELERKINGHPALRRAKPLLVVDLVSAHTGISAETILGRSRLKKTCEARFMAAWLIHETLGLSLHELGVLFQRKDHSSMSHMIRATNDRNAWSKPFSADLAGLLIKTETMLKESSK